MWKGAISFGLVTIPINLVSATEARETLAFHLLHKKDGSRIVEKRFCRDEDVEVRWKDIVKGYQYAENQYVVVTDDDFAKARTPATQAFEIRKFVSTCARSCRPHTTRPSSTTRPTTPGTRCKRRGRCTSRATSSTPCSASR